MTDNFQLFQRKADKVSKSLQVLSDVITRKLPPKDVLTIQDVSLYTGLSYSTLYRQSSRRLITTAKKGKRLFFPIIPFIDWYIESYLKDSNHKTMKINSNI